MLQRQIMSTEGTEEHGRKAMITFGFESLYLDKSGTSARVFCLNLLKVYFPCLPCIPWKKGC